MINIFPMVNLDHQGINGILATLFYFSFLSHPSHVLFFRTVSRAVLL